MKVNGIEEKWRTVTYWYRRWSWQIWQQCAEPLRMEGMPFIVLDRVSLKLGCVESGASGLLHMYSATIKQFSAWRTALIGIWNATWILLFRYVVNEDLVSIWYELCSGQSMTTSVIFYGGVGGLNQEVGFGAQPRARVSYDCALRALSAGSAQCCFGVLLAALQTLWT